MLEADVVIGANLGDEGKGLFTDYLSSRYDTPIIIRYNGGAQAGHTVETPDGMRHVFSHFGSGSFAGGSTYLSRFFVVNPLLFLRELQTLESLHLKPLVMVAPDCPVTTPFDMMVNQIAEEARGNARHGSCGVGFGETIGRHEETAHHLRVQDLTTAALRSKLEDLRDIWLPARLLRLGIRKIPAVWIERLNAPALIENFISACEAFLDQVTLCTLADIGLRRQRLIFEGAQGLLLDQSHDWFPHVTRSYTGLRNVVELAEEVGVGQLNVNYATRSYLTRHGAGPLPFELPEKPYEKIIDLTNKPHPFQGTLRFAPLNFDLLTQSIMADMAHAEGRLKINARLALSCMDQVDATALFINGGRRCNAPPLAMVNALLRRLGWRHCTLSYGPTRATIEADAKLNRQLYAV